MDQRRHSHLLNKRAEILGLTTNDMICLGVEFIFLNEAMRPFVLEKMVGILSLGIVALTMGILIPIRLKYRKKIIRDTLRFHLTRRMFYAQ